MTHLSTTRLVGGPAPLRARSALRLDPGARHQRLGIGGCRRTSRTREDARTCAPSNQDDPGAHGPTTHLPGLRGACPGTTRGSDPDDRGGESARVVHLVTGLCRERCRDLVRQGSPEPRGSLRGCSGARHQDREDNEPRSNALRGFSGIYDQLSRFAHPQALGVLASSSVTDDNTLVWSSAPISSAPRTN